MGVDVPPEAGQHLDDVIERVHIHADVERDEVDAAVDVAPEAAQIGMGIEREASMRVPDEGLLMNDFGSIRDGHWPEVSVVSIKNGTTALANSAGASSCT